MDGISSVEWATFLESVKEAKSQLNTSDGQVWFRGHKYARYYLLPSLLRYKNGLVKEKYLFNTFRKFSEKIFSRRDSEWETLFEMQHYFVPTRLLDWTETFGIALFFAAFYSDSSEDAAIFLLNPQTLNQYSRISKVYTVPREENEFPYSDIYWNHRPFAPHAPIAIEPIFINDRMSAQRGMFTVHDDSIGPTEDRFPEAIRKVVLPRGLIPAAREFLDLSNINEYSVYPDLGGLSDFLKTSSALELRR